MINVSGINFNKYFNGIDVIFSKVRVIEIFIVDEVKVKKF